MALRFTIGKKIGLGFGVLIFLTMIAFVLTMVTLLQSRKINKKITEIYTPSVSSLKELNLVVVRSKTLIFNWLYTVKESEDKIKLKQLISEEWPVLKQKLFVLAQTPEWNERDRKNILTTFFAIDTLFSNHKEIMYELNNFDSYNEKNVFVLESKNSVEDDDGRINASTRVIEDSLNHLIKSQQKLADQKTKDM